MSLFGWKEKQEIERLKALVPTASLEADELESKIVALRQELDALEDVKALKDQADSLRYDLAQLTEHHAAAQIELTNVQQELARKKFEIVETDDVIMLQSFGVYVPHYSFATSDEYKEKINFVRNGQKAMIRNGKAVSGATDWAVNGSKAKGEKMVADMQKLLLRAYNAECDDTIEHVRFNSYDSAEKRIRTTANTISKLGAIMGVSINDEYVKSKIEELRLVHEFRLKKQEEKEAAKELRAQQREEARAAKELADQRKKLEKEQTHYNTALKKLEDQIQNAKPEEVEALEEKKAQMVAQIEKLDGEMAAVDYRAANQKAGYVYVISNIGAFGDGVYKIGMTRRLEPMDRVDELGDASVPFNFDVHAMIFTDDAPALESALHRAFADKKLNFVNHRREFFRVSLDEIKKVIRENYDKTVEFVDVPPAEQYRESLRLREQAQE